MRSDLKTFYSDMGHPVDVHSQDFANVMAWLKDKGAPDPIIDSEVVGFPGGSFNTVLLTYHEPMKAPLYLNASTVMNSPQHAEYDIRMYFGYGDQNSGHLGPEYVGNMVVPPIKKPKLSLVGYLISGAKYTVGAGDDNSPIGTKCEDDPRGIFVKGGLLGPFGIMGAYWEKVG